MKLRCTRGHSLERLEHDSTGGGYNSCLLVEMTTHEYATLPDLRTMHRWNIPDRLPPVSPGHDPALSHSQSDNTLLLPRHHNKKAPLRALSRETNTRLHTALPSSRRPPGTAASSAAIGSSILEMELRLREVMAAAPAWPPNADRVHASLDSLMKMSRMPSPFKAILPLVAAELRNAVVSRWAGGSFGRDESSGPEASASVGILPPPLCYFEISARLDEQLRKLTEQAASERRGLQQAVHGRQALLDQKESDMRELLRERSALQDALQERATAEAALQQQIKGVQKELDRAAEDREALDDRLKDAEEQVKAKEEQVKEVQDLLTSEERKVMEQKEIEREHRSQSRFAAIVAKEQFKRTQACLVRCMHAALRAEGRGSTLLTLDKLPTDEQVSRAVSWAETLPKVKADDMLAVVSPPWSPQRTSPAKSPLGASPPFRSVQSSPFATPTATTTSKPPPLPPTNSPGTESQPSASPGGEGASSPDAS